MKKTALRLSIGGMALCLFLVVTGCGSTQSLLQESGTSYKQDEKNAWVNEPSAQSTNWTTYMDMEGG